MSGTIPNQIFMLPSIKYISLNNNSFEGIISDNISESALSESKLIDINLSYNKLQGKFPRNFTKLKTLSKLCIFDIFNDEIKITPN